MTERYLTITLQPDWKGALRAMAKTAQADKYQGEVLNFESPGSAALSSAMSSACTKTW